MPFSGRGCGRVAEVVETQVLEARLACEGRLWMNHREKHEVWTLLNYSWAGEAAKTLCGGSSGEPNTIYF